MIRDLFVYSRFGFKVCLKFTHITLLQSNHKSQIIIIDYSTSSTTIDLAGKLMLRTPFSIFAPLNVDGLTTSGFSKVL